MALKDSNIYSTCVGVVHYPGTPVTEPCDYQETDASAESPASPLVSPEAKQSRDKTNWQNPCEPSRLGRMLITEITEPADKKRSDKFQLIVDMCWPDQLTIVCDGWTTTRANYCTDGIIYLTWLLATKRWQTEEQQARLAANHLNL